MRPNFRIITNAKSTHKNRGTIKAFTCVGIKIIQKVLLTNARVPHPETTQLTLVAGLVDVKFTLFVYGVKLNGSLT